MAWHRADPTCQRLETIPGIGFISATALAATMSDAKVFRSGRQFAAWLGLVPKEHSSSGKQRMGISKMGETAICGISLSLGPLPSFGIRGTRRLPSASGQINCWSENQPRRCRQQDGTDRMGGYGS
jgi:hypothetical protein